MKFLYNYIILHIKSLYNIIYFELSPYNFIVSVILFLIEIQIYMTNLILIKIYVKNLIYTAFSFHHFQINIEIKLRHSVPHKKIYSDPIYWTLKISFVPALFGFVLFNGQAFISFLFNLIILSSQTYFYINFITYLVHTTKASHSKRFWFFFPWSQLCY